MYQGAFMIRKVVILIFLSLTSGIAFSSTDAGIGESEKSKKIAILPVENPSTLYTQNRNILGDTLFGALLQGAVNQQQSNLFAQKMEEKRTTMGEEMSQALVEELSKAGYEAVLIKDVRGPAEDPAYIDYKKIDTDAPVLHITFDRVAMYSSRLRSDYEHQINVSALLLTAKDEEYLYDEALYYGAESKGEQYWSIPSDPKYRYANFDDLVAKQDEVMEGFSAGIRALARHIGKEFNRLAIVPVKEASVTAANIK